jgi:putative phosphoribosyl transferase
MLLFEDREHAAMQLVRRLEKEWLDKEYNAKDKQQQQQKSNNNNIIILAIPRGGVVIGDVISKILDAKLDIIVSRKIGAPTNLELAIGAVMPDGRYFLNKDIVNMLNVPQSYIIEQANIPKKEIERRIMSFRGERGISKEGEDSSDPYSNNNFEEKIVILVDDGIATGATILLAAQWLKKKQSCCKMLIVAVPVAPPNTVNKIKEVSDKVIVPLFTRDIWFCRTIL